MFTAAQSPAFAQLFKYTLSQTGATVCVQTVPQFTDATSCYHGGNAVLITPTTVSIEAGDITNGLGSWSIATNATFMGINFFQFGSETQSNNQNFVNGTAVTLFCVNIDQGECLSGNVRLMLQTDHNTPAGTDPDLALYNAGVQHTVTASNANNCNPESGTVFNGLTGNTSYSCSALPVELIRFDAVAIDKAIELEWQSANEVGFSGYELQRSTNARDYTKLIWTPGQGGAEYKHLDTDVRPGVTYYYRLKLLDQDGSFEFSTIESALVQGAVENQELELSPNPAKGYFIAKFNCFESGKVVLEVFGELGQLAYKQGYDSREGENKLMVSTGKFNDGTYVVKLTTEDRVLSGKVIVTK